MKHASPAFVVLLFGVLLPLACSSPAEEAPSELPASMTASSEATPIVAGTATLDDCPVTLPVPPSAVPEEAARPIIAGSSNPDLTRARLSMNGNDAIWVGLPRDGVAQLDIKMGTVRLIPGKLSASAMRLDGPAPPPEFVIPEGYGLIGFQAFGIVFPTAGCCEVTQRVADRDFRFTLWVVE